MPPFVTLVGNVNTVSPVTNKSSPALSCNSSVSPAASTSPTTDPLIVNPGCVQLTCTLLMFEFAAPLPFTTEHTCAGFLGWARTVTTYAVPGLTGVVNVKGTFPVPETAKLSPPLFCTTNPDPMRPETEPPIVRPVVPQLIKTLVTLAAAVPAAFATLQV